MTKSRMIKKNISNGVKKIKGGITAPKGFFQSGVHCGLKKKKLDLALILSENHVKAAGVFTTNDFKAAPVLICKDYLKASKQKCVLINSGNANCLTGKKGIADAVETTRSLGSLIGSKKEEVLIASTGIIGKKMPMSKVKSGLFKLVNSLHRSDSHKAATAIMTTDAFLKELSYSFKVGNREVRIGAIAKGAGMIEPNMATMLSVITTDADISKVLLQKVLKEAVDYSFNRVTVDGDMSTNDTVLIMANGLSGVKITSKALYNKFLDALKQISLLLAKMIVKDGEGATKFIQINIDNALTKKQAKQIALKIANSNLFKTMCYGNDPNFGRVAAACGAAGLNIDSKKVDIYLNKVLAVKNGIALKDKLKSNLLKPKDINIRVNLNQGKGSAEIFTSDLSAKYLKINAAYN